MAGVAVENSTTSACTCIIPKSRSSDLVTLGGRLAGDD